MRIKDNQTTDDLGPDCYQPINQAATPHHAAIATDDLLYQANMVVQQHVLNWLYSVLTSVRLRSMRQVARQPSSSS